MAMIKDPVTGNWVKVANLSNGSGGGGAAAELTSALTATKTVGGITSGDNYAQGTTLEKVIRDMISPVLYPTFTAPSASLSATGAKLLEKGATLNTTFTATLNRGTINPAYGTSGYRSGATGYKLNSGAEQQTNTWSETITESLLQYKATVYYAQVSSPLQAQPRMMLQENL